MFPVPPAKQADGWTVTDGVRGVEGAGVGLSQELAKFKEHGFSFAAPGTTAARN